jgi:hypothetical protein
VEQELTIRLHSVSGQTRVYRHACFLSGFRQVGPSDLSGLSGSVVSRCTRCFLYYVVKLSGLSGLSYWY